jgi:hypothetical protein
MRSAAAGELNAINLKAVLWETLKGVRAGKLTPAQGDVVASQAREILRTSKVQLAIFGQAGHGVSQELIDFAKPTRGAR